MTSSGPPSAPAELLRALGVLAEPPEAGHARVAHALGLAPVPDGAAYAELFLFQLHPYASVYLDSEGMLGGDARERVAGFWRAVGRTPPAEPDHVSALLGLYAALLEEATDAVPAEKVMVRRSATALLHEHLAPWMLGYLERVGEAETADREVGALGLAAVELEVEVLLRQVLFEQGAADEERGAVLRGDLGEFARKGVDGGDELVVAPHPVVVFAAAASVSGASCTTTPARSSPPPWDA